MSEAPNVTQFPGVAREIYRRRKMEARNAYRYGSETLDELADRFQVEKADLTRMSRAEGWPSLRKKTHEDMARALEARAAVSHVHRRVKFLNDGSRMIDKLGDLINKDLDRIADGMPNANGIPPTLADVKAVTEALAKWVKAGKDLLQIPDEINLPAKRRSTGDIIDIEPMSPAGMNDPFAIEAPETPVAPIQ